MDGYEKLIRLNEKRIARLDMLIANAQTESMMKLLRNDHDYAVDEWYTNYERLLMLISILE